MLSDDDADMVRDGIDVFAGEAPFRLSVPLVRSLFCARTTSWGTASYILLVFSVHF